MLMGATGALGSDFDFLLMQYAGGEYDGEQDVASMMPMSISKKLES